MPIPAPDLDTRTWAELVREARLRIPRYTPEWTDLNDSDPGMTLVQLFAWLTETMLYQMNRLPDRNYVELLNLMGIEPRPARASTAQVSFLAESSAVPREIRPGTALLSQGSTEEGVPILFETSEALPMIRGKLEAVQAKVGLCFVDLTEANATEGDLYYPFGRTPQPGAELYLGFGPTLEGGAGESDDASTLDQESNLYQTPLGRGAARDRIDPEQSAIHSPFPARASLRVELDPGCSLVAPPVRLPELEWSVWTDRGWRPLEVEDGSEGFTRSGTLWLEDPRQANRKIIGEVEDALFYLRCKVRRWGTSEALPVDAVLPNTIPARSLETVRNQVLGVSSGLANQLFSLDHTPVDALSLRLRVEPPPNRDGKTPGPARPWRQVPDLFAAGPDERVYTLDPSNGVVTFGDGRHGRIPEPDATIVAARYRFGGGAASNVVAGSIDTPLDDLGDVLVTNWRPAVGGLDEESLAEAKRRAPLTLRNRDRAVTAEDYSALATQVGGVAQALTLPCFDPEHPGVDVPGAVTVVVLPDSTWASCPWLPKPSDALLDEVYHQLMPRRMVTTELIVVAPRFHELKIEISVWVDPEVGVEIAIRELRQAIDEALGVHGQRIGQELYPARFYTIAQQVPGVLAVRKLRLGQNNRPHRDFEKPLDPGTDGFFVLPPEGLRIEAEETPVSETVAFHFDGAGDDLYGRPGRPRR